MRLFCITILLLCSWMPQAQATVYEFHEDGTILKQEAFDYRSAQGKGQYEVLLPAIFQPSPLPGFTLSSEGYEAAIQNAAFNYGLNADLIRAVISIESAGKYNAVSPKGAKGLMQLMPATARQYGVLDPFDPEQNIDGGSKYLGYLLGRYAGDTTLALAAYNAGEGTVDRYKGVPPYAETIAYVQKVKSALK